MKSLTKCVGISLVVLMLMSSFIACGQSKHVEKDVIQEPTEAHETDNGEEKEEKQEEKTGPSWSWDTSPITIDWYVHEGWYDKKWDIENSLVDKHITEKTGVNINIMTPAGDADEKLNTMIAAGTLPDVVTLGWYFIQWQQMQEGSLLQPLGELIDQHAPTFWDIIPPTMVGWYTYEDDKWYGFPSFYWAEEHISDINYWETNSGMIARKDLMEEYSITAEDFKTQEGMIEALKKIRDAKIEYNGLPVVPINLGPNGGISNSIYNILPDFFAISQEDQDGNLINTRMHPKFLEVLQFVNTLYREGLMSKENFTMQRKQVEEKLASGAVFCLLAQISDYKSQQKDLFKNDPAAKTVPVGPVLAADGATPYFGARATAGWTVSAITKNAKNPERIIRFFEYCYSDEGQRDLDYGVEGVTYNIVDGRVRYTEEYMKDVEEDAAKANIKYGHNMFWWFYNPPMDQIIRPMPETEADMMIEEMEQYFGKYAFNNAAFSDLAPRGGTEEATILAEISEYWDEQVAIAVMAESPEEVERTWKDTIDEINKMGYSAVYEIQNKRFYMLKERLGQEYAWPPNKE